VALASASLSSSSLISYAAWACLERPFDQYKLSISFPKETEDRFPRAMVGHQEQLPVMTMRQIMQQSSS
jgi:hypothetical protein